METVFAQPLANKINGLERHDFLYPSKKLNWADSKMINFTKRARPELFPVKDEHSRPLIQHEVGDRLNKKGVSN